MSDSLEWKKILTQQVYEKYIERISGDVDKLRNIELTNTAIIIMAINKEKFIRVCEQYAPKIKENFFSDHVGDKDTFTISNETKSDDLFENINSLAPYFSIFTSDYIEIVKSVINMYSDEKGDSLLAFIFGRSGIKPILKTKNGIVYYEIDYMPWVENSKNNAYIKGKKIKLESAYRQFLGIKDEYEWLSGKGNSPKDNKAQKILSEFKKMYPEEYENFVLNKSCDNYEIIINILDSYHRIPRERIEYIVKDIILKIGAENDNDENDEWYYELICKIVDQFVVKQSENDKYILSNYSEEGYNIKLGNVEISYSKILFYLSGRKNAMKKADIARELGKTEEYVSRRWKNLITEMRAALKVRK